MSLFGAAASDITIAIVAKDQATKVFEGVKEKTAETFGESGGLAKYAKMGAIGVAAVGTAAVAGVTALFALANNVSKTGDEFHKMSQRTGVSVENLSTLGFAAERSGTSLGTLENGLKRLSANMLDASKGTGAAKDAFAELGVEVKDSNGTLKRSDDLMMELADRFMRLEDDTKAAALAQQIFGKSGTDMLPFLRQGSAEIRELQGRARDLGREFSTTAANDSAAFQDAMTDLSSAFSGITQSIALAVIPTFTMLINAFTDGVVWVRDFVKAAGGLPQMFSDIGTVVVEFVKSYFEHFIKLFTEPEYLVKFVSNFASIFASILTLQGKFILNLGEVIDGVAGLLWVPIETAGLAIWDVLKAGAVTGFNGIITALVTPINSMIDLVNSVGGAFGVSLGKVDFTPITVTAPKSMEDRWEETKEKMSAKIGEIGGSFTTLKDDVIADAGKVKDDVVKAWNDTTIGSNTKIQELVGKYKSAMEDASTGPEAVSKAVGAAAGEGLATEFAAQVQDPESGPAAVAAAAGADAGEKLGEGIAKTAKKDGFLSGFERNFQSALEMSLGNLIRTGDFKGAIGKFGENMLDGIIGGIAKNASQKITTALFGGGGGESEGGDPGGGLGGAIKSFFSGSGAGGFTGILAQAVPMAGLVALGLTWGGEIVSGIKKAAGAIKGLFSGLQSGGEFLSNFDLGSMSIPDLQNLRNTAIAASGGIYSKNDKDSVLSAIDQAIAAKTQTGSAAGLQPFPVNTGGTAPAQTDSVGVAREMEQRANAIIAGAQMRAQVAIEGGRLNLTFSEFQELAGLMGGFDGKELAHEAVSRRSDDQAALEYFISSVTSILRLPHFPIGGMVPGPIGRPQLVVAHGGEEFVPHGRGFVGGARSGATIVNYFQTVVQTPDSDGMRRLIDGEFGDLILARIFRESAGANPVVHDRGIFSPPVV